MRTICRVFLTVAALALTIAIDGLAAESSFHETKAERIEASLSLTSSVVYVNTAYRFRFSLPASWKGYKILTSIRESSGCYSSDAYVRKCEKGPLLSIRHPLWTKGDPRQDIPIMVFTQAQWAERERLCVSAAPFPPSEIAHNKKYVFALPPRYNYGFETGYEEVEKIFGQRPLHPY